MMRKHSIVRQTLLTLVAIFGLLALIIYPETAAAISIKEKSVVSSGTITLGDIFDGLPRDADKVMGIAPQPGREMVLDSRTLLRIALALDLPWRPDTSADSVVITRAATLVDRDMIESALHSSIDEKGINGEYKLVFADNLENIVLPQDTAPGVEVTAMDINPQSNWFEATLAAPSKDKPLTTSKVSGRIEYITKVPVLRENLNNGSIIGANDIDYINLPQKNIKPGIVLKAEDLIGMTPRRVILAGQVIQTNDYESPRMVARGDIVTMAFNNNGLSLTAEGKALEHGSKGDRIRVMNTGSNRVVTGEVTNTKEITVKEF